MASGNLPAYQRIAQRLRRAIAEGRVGPGGKLPSERELASREGVSLMTARRALTELEREGLARRRVGAGTFATPARAARRRLLDPHELFQAPICRLAPATGARLWCQGDSPVVEETITLASPGELADQPLLHFLGAAASFAVEEIHAANGHLRIHQTIYTDAQELLAVRDMIIYGQPVVSTLER
jgi:DNA-binding transcriptional regulator YhcF (GntR family)